MEKIDVINNILQITIINIFVYLVFIKLTNYKQSNNKKVIIISIIGLIEAIIGTILVEHIEVLPSMILVYLLTSFVVSKLTENKFSYSILVTFISLTITYLIYIISIILSGVFLKIIFNDLNKDNIAILIGAIIIEGIVIWRIFKIKRLKDGLTFLKNTDKVNNIGFVGFALIGATMLIYSMYGIAEYFTYLFLGIIIESICMVIWIRKKITKYYKQKMKEKTIEELENEIEDKNKTIEKVLEENRKISTINHKYSSRIQALEKFSNEISNCPKIIENMKVEFGEDFEKFNEQIKILSTEYSKEIDKNIKHEEPLTKTGVFGIDNILKYMQEEANKSNIKFKLKITGNINYMVEKVISQSKLETMLGDHIKNAIIAISSSKNTYRSILTIIGIIDKCYEIVVYDTGIEFEIETLLKLGTKETTTHKETGGTGIGFMTTFETLKETKASLIIEEKHPIQNMDYTKAVIIKFDGKSEYRICSYRAEELKKNNKDKRIIIENI